MCILDVTNNMKLIYKMDLFYNSLYLFNKYYTVFKNKRLYGCQLGTKEKKTL